MAVVGGDQRNAGFFRQPHQVAIDARLDFQPLVLHFEEEIAFAENIAQAVGVRARLVVFLGEQRVGHFAAQAGGKRDQSLAVLGEKLVIHARLVIEAVEKAGGNKLDEIAVAFVVLAKQNQVVRALGIRAAVLVIVRRDVHFAADDRLHAVRRGLVIEIRGRKKIAVIGDGHRGHAAARGFLGEFADFAGAVEKGVIRVQMQMYEIWGSHENLF